MKAWVCDICDKVIRKDAKQKIFTFELLRESVRERDIYYDHLVDPGPVCSCIDICQHCLEEKFKKKEAQGNESQSTVSVKNIDFTEWLEWRIMNAKHNGIKEAADAFEFVLQCWEEEET